MMRGLICGWLSAKSRMNASERYSDTPCVEAMVSVYFSARAASTSSFTPSSRRMTICARRYSASPCGVGFTPKWLRAKSDVPSSASIFWMILLHPWGLRNWSFAARVMLFVS